MYVCMYSYVLYEFNFKNEKKGLVMEQPDSGETISMYLKHQ